MSTEGWLWAGRLTYLSHICAHLSGSSKEFKSRHPFVVTESRLPCKVVDMLYQSLEYIFQSRIRAIAVDSLYIFGNVVDREIFKLGRVDF